jgi:hypothetical protein
MTMKMKGRTAVASAAGILLCAIVGAAIVTAAGGDKGRAAVVSQSDAVQTVKVASRSNATLEVKGTIDSPVSRAYVVTGIGVDALVDVSTGQLGMLSMSANAPSSADVAITESAALDAAATYLTAAGLPKPKATPSVSLVDHQSTKEYVVIWARRVNGVVVPDQTIVKVNPATGSVFSVVRISRQFADPARPGLAKSDADAVARAKSVKGKATLVAGEVTIMFDNASGAQRSAWRLEYEVDDGAGSFYGEMVFVDADTGDVVAP